MTTIQAARALSPNDATRLSQQLGPFWCLSWKPGSPESVRFHHAIVGRIWPDLCLAPQEMKPS